MKVGFCWSHHGNADGLWCTFIKTWQLSLDFLAKWCISVIRVWVHALLLLATHLGGGLLIECCKKYLGTNYDLLIYKSWTLVDRSWSQFAITDSVLTSRSCFSIAILRLVIVFTESFADCGWAGFFTSVQDCRWNIPQAYSGIWLLINVHWPCWIKPNRGT